MKIARRVRSIEAMQESLALLKVLALGKRDVAAGAVRPVGAAFKHIRRKIKARK